MSATCSVAQASLFVGQLGASDCEELGDGFLAQPVNAITSLAYLVIGAIVVIGASRRGTGRADAWVFGLLLAGISLGSVAFHGPQPDGSRLMHDLPITLTVLYMVSADLALLQSGRPSRWALFVPAAAVATLVTLVSFDAGNALTGLSVIVIAGLEFVLFRRNTRGHADPGRRRGALIVIVLAAVAAATWLFGRTDSPVCDPDGLFQVHGLWHLVSAGIFAVWWFVAGPSVTVTEQPASRPAARAAN